MSKEHLLNLLCRVYVQEISADEAFDELEDLIERIKRLEEAGDSMGEWLANSRNLGADPFLSELWRKAKEDKP